MRYEIPERVLRAVALATKAAVKESLSHGAEGIQADVLGIAASGILTQALTQQFGRPGLFWMYVALAHEATHGVISQRPGEVIVTGIGQGNGTVWLEQRIVPFVTAVVDADQHNTPFEAAVEAFDAAIPAGAEEHPLMCEEVARTCGWLFEIARIRAAGKPLVMQFAPGSAWPPPCDFCTVKQPPAVVMYPCKPFEAIRQTDDGGHQRVINFTPEEAAQWYACGPCRDAIDANTWTVVRDRYSAARGGIRVSQEVAVMWLGFRANRTGDALPLPAERPGT